MRKSLKFHALRQVHSSIFERPSLNNRTTYVDYFGSDDSDGRGVRGGEDLLFSSRYAERRLEPGICDFTFGNPHEMPLEGIVTAIRERAIPHDKNWFAYKTSEQDPRAFVAERLGRELDLTFVPGAIGLTAGAFAAIMVAFRLVVDAGDEVIYSEPAWFCYEPMLLAADAVPRKVKLQAS